MATATASKQAPAKRTNPKSSTSATYTYKGVDRKGNKVDGEVDGSSQALVRAQLLKQGIRVNSVRKKPKPLFGGGGKAIKPARSEEHTSELQSRGHLVCRLLLEKKKTQKIILTQ